jgi:hypothetical protein
MTDTVSPQVTDAVTQSNTSVLGGSPALAMGQVYQSMAHSISLAMQNAVTTQYAMQQINVAVVSTNCKKIVELAN